MEPPKAPRPRPKPRSKRKDLTLCPRCLHIVPEVDRLQAENAELRELVVEYEAFMDAVVKAWHGHDSVANVERIVERFEQRKAEKAVTDGE